VGRYVVANSRPPMDAHWSYQYLIQVGREDYVFHVDLAEDTQEDQRDELAQEEFKKIVALIAKKVAV
jgi:hypothetical protein